MIEVRQTTIFRDWMADLKDSRARARIAERIDRITLGNPGGAKSVGGGVSELKIDYGPGYRLYFTWRGKRLLLLLCGGDKSTQGRDIDRAKALVKELKNDG